MIIEQSYTGGLSQGASYINSYGEVANIDPIIEVSLDIKKPEFKLQMQLWLMN